MEISDEEISYLRKVTIDGAHQGVAGLRDVWNELCEREKNIIMDDIDSLIYIAKQVDNKRLEEEQIDGH